MTNADPILVRDWIALQHAAEGSEERERLLDTHDRVSDLVLEQPESAWCFVLEALRIDSSTAVKETLSAGPLEDLLAQHGPLVVDRIEKQARLSPEFASLLGGVWKSSITDEVWERVQKVWDRRGWDGIPAA